MAVPRVNVCTDAELASALVALHTAPRRVRARDWPASAGSIDEAGLYSWWVDPAGAVDLASGLGLDLGPGRIYAGQTGATKWPSGQIGAMSLRQRIMRNHLGGTIRGSTFRLTLAAILREQLDLRVALAGRLDRESELRVADWMHTHLELAVHPCANRDALAHLERRVLDVLDPPLNLHQMPPTPIRWRLTALRRELLTAES